MFVCVVCVKYVCEICVWGGGLRNWLQCVCALVCTNWLRDTCVYGCVCVYMCMGRGDMIHL